uniref:adenylate cyclase n=1 Tax=Anopheles maculatus TaxID=74869 RepID=A0A182SF05_9DIPT
HHHHLFSLSRSKLYVQKHTNVTILYADVVNYTHMTTQLPVRTLVDVLHELFVKFDEASKEFNVLRIKFLGDCYYCVSGVPVRNKYHAKSCVNLGLRMIKDIRDVRMSRDLNIDMRIGIHSGSIISGVIGACKWQYDIWSKDVIIANKMESTGEAGKVHVTMQTLELLDGEYIFEEGTQQAKEDPILVKHNIQTFLIVPQPGYDDSSILNEASGMYFWLLNGLSGALLFAFIPITWFKKVWDVYTPYSIDDLLRVRKPQSRLMRIFYDFSNDIMGNYVIRTVIYLITIALLVVCSMMYLIECNYDLLEQTTTSVAPAMVDDSLTSLLQETRGPFETPRKNFCTNPWSVTQCLTLAIGMAFLFLRIHFLLKAAVGLFIFFCYCWAIFDELYYYFDSSASMNPGLDPKASHLMLILFIVIIFHWIDRQSEYIARTDYNWKQQLLKQKEEAEVTKQTNKILVENILPTHVAEIYINRQLKNEFYNEEYENVAVMFATITNMEVNTDISVENEKSVLKVLNEIICDFDERLQYFDGYLKVEKIKVAGWTYMAACGLDPGRCDSSSSLSGYRSVSGMTRTSLMTNGRRSLNPRTSLEITHKASTSTRSNSSSSRQSNNVTIVMAEFALELMRVLRDFSNENFKQTSPGLLRVGISHGKVMAGVVGSSKPLYDIWGNAVNMASRMDSTGRPGRIQVTKESAEVLQSYGYQCDYRGEIFVKGRGKIPTYFLKISNDLKFLKKTSIGNESTEHITTKL